MTINEKKKLNYKSKRKNKKIKTKTQFKNKNQNGGGYHASYVPPHAQTERGRSTKQKGVSLKLKQTNNKASK